MESILSISTVKRSCLLLLRVLTFVFLLIALILIAITTQTVETASGEAKFKFNDLHSFRYMLATIVIGLAYNLMQMSFSIFSIVSGDRLLSCNGGYIFDFYGDKIISYLLATGGTAGLGASQDVHRIFEDTLDLNLKDFFAKANASASLLLIAFLCSAVSSISSSYALAK